MSTFTSVEIASVFTQLMTNGIDGTVAMSCIQRANKSTFDGSQFLELLHSFLELQNSTQPPSETETNQN